ncbi:MAG: HyaD/HybD family hydrogenase maturation endopeptidase [Polyangiales bacterium]
MDPTTPPGAIVVLGLGNVLWADEGFGVRCVEALTERYVLPAAVSVLDGGTQGLYLLPYIRAANQLLIFDAVDYGLPAGTLHCVRDAEVPRFLGAKKLSLHQTGFQEVLALAELTGRYPRQILLVGCQPEVLDDFGGSLRPLLRAALEPALSLGLAELASWGVDVSPRSAASADASCLGLTRYEAERPSEAAAFRGGDPRFLPLSAADAEER